jgi:hypothetical protein
MGADHVREFDAMIAGIDERTEARFLDFLQHIFDCDVQISAKHIEGLWGLFRIPIVGPSLAIVSMAGYLAGLAAIKARRANWEAMRHPVQRKGTPVMVNFDGPVVSKETLEESIRRAQRREDMN